MPKASPFRVRFAIVGIFSALALAFLISPGRAQPGRPGGISGMPGGGISGRPPGFGGNPGGIAGNPGGVTGMPGGITGRPPLAPLIPPPPAMPGGFGGNPGGFGGITTYSWTCGKCKASLGTTTTPFSSHTRCPFCGVTFTGTNITGGGGTGGGGSKPPVVPPAGSGGGAPAGNDAPTLPTNPAVGNPTFTVNAPAPDGAAPTEPNPPAPTNPAPPSTDGGSTASPPPPASSNRSRTFILIGVVVGLILLVGALAVLGVLVSNAAKPVKRKRRKAFDDE